MSDKSRVFAQSYGRSFFDALKDSLDAKHLEGIETELKSWAELFKGELGVFLDNASFYQAEKIEVLEKLFSELKSSESVKKLILIMCHQGHTALVPEALSAFQKAKLEHQMLALAYVETAFELTENQTHQMREALEKKLGKKVLMNIRLNKDLMCGVRVRLGSLVFDASVSGTLNKLQEKHV